MPSNELEFRLTRIWEQILGVRPIARTANFFDLGGHSLLAVRLLAHIEKRLGKSLPVAALFHAPTIAQLAELISREGWRAQWKSLVAIQPGGSRPPLFCVHAHDGNVLFWRDLARHLGADQPFYALQPRGADGEQSLHNRVEEMASHYLEEIRSLQPQGPYFLGGHCLGGVIAFEMAQQLEAQGEKVGMLALFDSYAPRREGAPRRSRWYRYRQKAIRNFELGLGLHIGNLLALPAQERLAYIKGKLNKAVYKLYMGLGSTWIPAARRRADILRAGAQAARLYKPTLYPGKITLFRARQLGRGISHDPHLGWDRLAGGGLETHVIPGYHAHIVLEPRVRVLAQELTAVLSNDRQAATNKKPEQA
jgi:thioesterase domain-containing protein/acyl carrier protein